MYSECEGNFTRNNKQLYMYRKIITTNKGTYLGIPCALHKKLTLEQVSEWSNGVNDHAGSYMTEYEVTLLGNCAFVDFANITVHSSVLSKHSLKKQQQIVGFQMARCSV